MNFAQSGEPLSVMLSEVTEDCLVGVEAEELSDELDGDGLRIGELGGRPALANTAALEPVVYEAEDGYDEGAKIHKKKTSATSGAIESTPSVGRSSLWLNSSRETCTSG